MKNTKTVVNASIALAFVLFSSIQLSAMESQREQRLNQLDQALEQAKQRKRQAHEEYGRAMSQDNPEEIRETEKAYMQARADELRAVNQIMNYVDNG